MQTTQEQPPPYSPPVIQPHLVQPALANVKEGYNSYRVRRLAMIQIVLGCFAFGFQLWDIINMSNMSIVAAGMWSGAFFISTGCLGLHSANQKTVGSIVTYMVMSIFASFLAIVLLVVSSINLDYYNNCNYYKDWRCSYMTDYMRTCTIFLSTMLIIISLVEGFMAIFAASLACHGCCNPTATNETVLSYVTPTQYVQGPNHQLLLLTSQQTQIVTTTNGQQVLVAANLGGYQVPELHLQGNYQTLAVPTQPYMAIVPTMHTQQPMPQPDSVQPPAYQAVGEQTAGTQQPQVHQAAADGKTNMAYVDN